MSVVRIGNLNELTTLTAPDYFLVYDAETSSPNVVKYENLLGGFTISSLGDISINSNTLQDGQALVWNSTTQKFENKTLDNTGGGGGDSTLVDYIYEALGILSGSRTLPQFPGTVLPDNSTVTEAFGAVETELVNLGGRIAAEEARVPDADEFIWDSSLTPDSNKTYDLGSSSYRIRNLYLSDDSIKFENGNLSISGGKLSLNSQPLALESYVDDAVAAATGVDLTNYYTKSEVDTAIAGVSVDLSGYYTKSEIDNAGFLTSFTLGDGEGLELGDDADLKLYFDGNIGVQTSFIESDALIVRSKTGSEEYITAIKDGPVELYYDGSKKFGTSANGASVLGDLEVDGKVYFKNVFNTLGDLPSATTYHGMFAHVHGEGAAYYAHGGNWVKLANDVDIPSLTGYATETYVNTQVSGISVPSNLGDLGDVTISGTPTTGHVLKWDGSTWTPAADGGAGGGGISLTDLSVTQNAASGGGALTYNNVSGVFEYTPPVIPTPSTPSILNLNGVDSTDTPATDDVLVYSEVDSEFKLENLTSIVSSFALQNIADAGYGVDVTGKIATTDGIDIDIGGSINAAGTTLDFQNTTVSFTGATIGGLGPSDVNLGNIANAGYGVDVTGKIATTDGIDIDIGGSINAAGTTLDFQNTTISFSGANITGLSSTINDQIDFKLDKYNAADGQVLTWDSSLAGGNGDYTWTTPATGGGATTLGGLTDVVVSSVSNGEVLTYNSATSSWVPQPVSGGGGATTLDALTDVSTSGVTTGQVLKYNGTSWAPSDDIDTDTNVDLTSVNSTLTQLQEFQQNILANTAVSNLSFTANNTAGSSPLSVSLSTSYTGNANSFDVDWGDGTQDTGLSSNQLNHTYTNASGGLFDITVTAANTAGVGFGSNAVANREDYIVLYTPQPVLDFDIRKSAGGIAVTGNDRWVLIGDNVYLTNDSNNVIGVNATFEYSWGDGSLDLTSNDTDPGAILGPAVSHTYSTDGYYTLTLKLTGHDATDPSYLNSTTTDNIKVYNPNPATPTGLANKLNDFSGSSASLASGFTDNTGGLKSAGDSVKRMTSGSMQTSMSYFAYNAESGTLTANRNGVSVGLIFMNQPHNEYLTDGELALNGESDYNLLTTGGVSTTFANSTYYPGLYKGFKARTITNYASSDDGLNVVKLTHSVTGDSNERFFVKDTSTTPSLDVSSATITELVSGAKKFISGIPYYSSTNSTIQVSGVVANDFTTECYSTANPLNLTSNSSIEAGVSDPVQNTTYSYSQVEGGAQLLDGSIPLANVTSYTLDSMNILPQSNAYGSRKLRVRARNINGYGSYEVLPTIIQTFSRDQSIMNVDERDISVSTSLGNGALTDGGVRIMDFKNETTDTPTFNGGTDYYTNNSYTESSASSATGVLEAAVIYGSIDHNAIDYSTGYLPVGPDRSGSTGTQYFTFAFRRQVVANFNIRINTGGIAGCWIAAPGTAIDNTSGINGWLDTSQAYAGSGVPGSDTGAGGNGSDGCASNNSSRILSNTSINGTYTMTLGEENMSNATGNVVLVRIALNSGQSISTLEVN